MDTAEVAVAILTDESHSGQVMLTKDDACAMARVYLKYKTLDNWVAGEKSLDEPQDIVPII